MDAQLTWQHQTMFEVFAWPVWKIHTKQEGSIYSSILASFLAIFKLYNNFLHIFELPTSTGLTPPTAHGWLLMMVTQKGGAHAQAQLISRNKLFTKLLVTPYVRIQPH